MILAYSFATVCVLVVSRHVRIVGHSAVGKPRRSPANLPVQLPSTRTGNLHQQLRIWNAGLLLRAILPRWTALKPLTTCLRRFL